MKFWAQACHLYCESVEALRHLETMGSGASKSMEPEKMEVLEQIMKEHPVRVPCLPGDVLVSGDMPLEVVEQLAEYCKGWLYVNPDSDPHFMPEAIKSKDCALKVVPFKPSKDLASSVVDEVFTSISELPRPLMIQCTSANRAAIALLLWMADQGSKVILSMGNVIGSIQLHGHAENNCASLVGHMALDTSREHDVWSARLMRSLRCSRWRFGDEGQQKKVKFNWPFHIPHEIASENTSHRVVLPCHLHSCSDSCWQ